MERMGWINVFVIGDGWTLTTDVWDIAKIDYLKHVIARKAKITRKGMRMMTVGGHDWPVRHAPRWTKATDWMGPRDRVILRALIKKSDSLSKARAAFGPRARY